MGLTFMDSIRIRDYWKDLDVLLSVVNGANILEEQRVPCCDLCKEHIITLISHKTLTIILQYQINVVNSECPGDVMIYIY